MALLLMESYILYTRVNGCIRKIPVYGEFRMRSIMTVVHRTHNASCLRVVGEEKEVKPLQ